MKKKGFTLIELLVVMTIIIILIGFMVPKIGGYRAKANKLKAENCAKQIYTAAMCSYGENNGQFEKVSLENTIELLIGAKKRDENINVESVDKDIATITFEIEDKNYSMEIDKENYILKDTEDISQ